MSFQFPAWTEKQNKKPENMISVHHITCQDQISKTINHLAMDTEISHIIKVHFKVRDKRSTRSTAKSKYPSVLKIHQTTAPHSAIPPEFPSQTVIVSSSLKDISNTSQSAEPMAPGFGTVHTKAERLCYQWQSWKYTPAAAVCHNHTQNTHSLQSARVHVVEKSSSQSWQSKSLSN